MKRARIVFFAICELVLVSIFGLMLWSPKLAAIQVGHDHSKHETIMNVLSDSVMLDLMMDHIASDSARSSKMVERLVYYAVGDTSRTERLCSKWIENESIRALMAREMRKTSGNAK